MATILQYLDGWHHMVLEAALKVFIIALKTHLPDQMVTQPSLNLAKVGLTLLIKGILCMTTAICAVRSILK